MFPLVARAKFNVDISNSRKKGGLADLFFLELLYVNIMNTGLAGRYACGQTLIHVIGIFNSLSPVTVYRGDKHFIITSLLFPGTIRYLDPTLYIVICKLNRVPVSTVV